MLREYAVFRLKLQATRKPRRLVVGAGGVCDPGWLSTNIEVLNILKEHDWGRIFREGTIDTVLSEHVWEHLTEEEGRVAAELSFRYLRPGGYCRIAVPDGLCPDQAYIQAVRPGGDLKGRHAHKVMYTYRTLGALFSSVGFAVTFYEFYDEEAVFNYQEWDPSGGKVWRSKRFDQRNADGKLRYTSLVMDAFKPGRGSQ
jgi:predicted SAM-dependent methyltransferase